MIIHSILGSIFFVLNLRSYLFFNNSLPMLRLNFILALKLCGLIQVVNTCLVSFMLSSNKKALLLSVLVHIHLNKMVWLNVKIDIC